MFSGIVEHLGTIVTVDRGNGASVLVIDTGMTDIALGESIAVNGVCLTATAPDESGRTRFFVSQETLDRTALGAALPGRRVNLERAVTPATRLSGHIVQGHVDGTARLASVDIVGDARRLIFAVPAALRRYMVEKGSVALDGISLTLNTVGEPGAEGLDAGFCPISLMIIPHTWEHTTLSQLAPGDAVNVEVEVIAKDVESLCRTQ
jgi:riboflavin synthase